MTDEPSSSPEVILTGSTGQLYGRLWQGRSIVDRGDQPGAVVIMIHGLGDHGGRFDDVANFLTDQIHDLAIFSFDLPGHGQSPGSPGSLHRYNTILAEIASVRSTMRERFGDRPHVLLGHSMGGNLAINYAIRSGTIDPDAAELAGLVLASPMLLPPKPLPRPAIFAAWLTGYLLPFWRFQGDFKVDKLTSDPQQMQKISEDPAMHSKISMHLATQLVAQGRWAIDHARSVTTPTLIVYGQQDQMIDRSACDNVAIRMGQHAEVIKLPDTRHALFHDVERDLIFGQLANWIKRLI